MESISQLVKKQRDFYFTHKTKSYEFRKNALINLKNAINEHKDEILKALKADLAKCEFEAYATEIGIVLEEISFTVKNLKEWMSIKKVTTPTVMQPATSQLYYDPYGVALVIAPWNYPFQLTLAPVVGAIAGGNTVIIKPSEFSEHTSAIIEKIIKKTFSEDYITVIQGGVKETQALLAQKFDYIFFTGSTQVGKIVMKAASEYLTPVTLELGGKSPCIIDKDADLAVSAMRIAWGKFLNAGQTCVAPDYLLIDQSIKEKFLGELKKAFESFYNGDPKKSPDYTRIINHKHFDRLINLMKDGKVIFGGNSDRENKFIEITLLENTDPKSQIMNEEIFGPLMPVITYQNIDEAINFINERPKPLALYLFSANEATQDKVLALTTAGGCCINETVYQFGSPYLPAGGVGESGVGRYHGEDSFKCFTHQKSVFKRSFWPDIKLRYAPYKDKVKLLKFFMN